MRDRDVRAALRRKVLTSYLRDPGTLVIDELGIQRGAARVDIAVINGRLHAFEIKSEADTLARLPSQAEAYSAVFDRVTLVLGRRHVADVAALVPAWWGLKLAYPGLKGAVHFETVRASRPNPIVDPLAVARLLWREELVAALERAGVPRGIRGKSRETLCRMLAERLPSPALREIVRDCLKLRRKWRSGAA